MVMTKNEGQFLEGVRKAILADVSEDMGTIGNMTEEHNVLVDAWNAFANAGVHGKPITNADIEGMYDDA